MKKKLTLALSLLLSLLFSVSSPAALTPLTALGDTNRLAASATPQGDVYVNDFGRAYFPLLDRWGSVTEHQADGTGLLQVDPWGIADVLGEYYTLLAFTSDRGNCYTNSEGKTYTPGTNEVGHLAGYSGGVPIIQVDGIAVYTAVTRYYLVPLGDDGNPIFSSGQETAPGTASTTVNNLPPVNQVKTYRVPIQDSDRTAAITGSTTVYVARTSEDYIFHPDRACSGMIDPYEHILSELLEGDTNHTADWRLCKNCAQRRGLLD